MPSIKIDGRLYPVPSEFTGREWATIKRLSGARPADLDAALVAGDAEAIIALVVISMRRAGATVDEDALLDMPFSAIEWVDDEEPSAQESSGPPAPAADGEPAAAA